MFQLNFEKFLVYDTSKNGIELNVVLRSSAETSVKLAAKIDTGADHCIFERRFGEELGLKIENGIKQRFSTATELLRLMVIT